ncbi:hypothetical protein KVR01_009392 [Diaporthe batatas]|uniref:uncharacterized protein n=1 Tax=Diaporthe batatas TaxID=748121 RepID=UPI001D04B317|nr:uncharacterized protein KVR01_009392 [Diaporthe batatas]KAG8161128.1 hypothetical protein KVR01_009392 [Diaporthe batatas]
MTKSGEWHTYQIFPTMTLNVSLCFAGLHTDVYNVSMSNPTGDPKEPEVRWEPIHRDDAAEAGQNFMGAAVSGISAGERGILSISEFTRPHGFKAEDVHDSSNTLWIGPSSFIGMFAQSGASWIMCTLCTLFGWAVPPDIAALFSRTIHTTGRPSWAIQSFLTTYTQSWYAQFLPELDVAADIDATFSTQARIPRYWGGLIAALVMNMVNLVCVWIIAVLYVVRTRYSRQGNVWHTVSQMMSEDTRIILEQSNKVKDNEVKKALKSDDYLVFIGIPAGSDRISVLRS